MNMNITRKLNSRLIFLLFVGKDFCVVGNSASAERDDYQFVNASVERGIASTTRHDYQLVNPAGVFLPPTLEPLSAFVQGPSGFKPEPSAPKQPDDFEPWEFSPGFVDYTALDKLHAQDMALCELSATLRQVGYEETARLRQKNARLSEETANLEEENAKLLQEVLLLRGREIREKLIQAEPEHQVPILRELTINSRAISEESDRLGRIRCEENARLQQGNDRLSEQRASLAEENARLSKERDAIRRRLEIARDGMSEAAKKTTEASKEIQSAADSSDSYRGSQLQQRRQQLTIHTNSAQFPSEGPIPNSEETNPLSGCGKEYAECYADCIQALDKFMATWRGALRSGRIVRGTEPHKQFYTDQETFVGEVNKATDRIKGDAESKKPNILTKLSYKNLFTAAMLKPCPNAKEGPDGYEKEFREELVKRFKKLAAEVER